MIVLMHYTLGYLLEEITQATGKEAGPHLIGMFKTYKACAMGKAKMAQNRCSPVLSPHIRAVLTFVRFARHRALPAGRKSAGPYQGLCQ